MCGIVGAISKNNVVPTLLECLKRLEYRGYDSAGVAVIESPNNNLRRLRSVGKIDSLNKKLEEESLSGNTGIAHTRWATHGAPTEFNAHPHFSSNTFALVHNGIIENYQELRENLIKSGYKFSSETDTEVIAHSIHKNYEKKSDFLSAVYETSKELTGMYSLAIIHSLEPNRIIAVRRGSSLVVGLSENDGEYFLASDRIALAKVVNKIIYLEDGDFVDLNSAGISIYNSDLQPVTRQIQISSSMADAADRGKYKHYMLKEIFEQPEVLASTLEDRLQPNCIDDNIFGINAENIFPKVERVQIIACGTSYHAGLVGSYWLGEYANLPCKVDIASEFRYKKNPTDKNTLLIAISQSGETADTLAVIRQAKNMGYLACLAICNVDESSLMREADLQFLTRAGTEIGVAATKTFTAQLIAMFLLAIAIGKYHGLEKTLTARLIQFLKHLPGFVEEALNLNDQIKLLAENFVAKQHVLYLGRGPLYPIALEGALKMKEISYIHAEAYAAGELKHGPLALIDKNMPVIVLAPNDTLLSKLQSNIKEVEARGGELIIFTDSNLENFPQGKNITIINMPKAPPEIAPIIYTIPLQILAYGVAVLKGTDVDQPRNLAKSVTVE